MARLPRTTSLSVESINTYLRSNPKLVGLEDDLQTASKDRGRSPPAGPDQTVFGTLIRPSQAALAGPTSAGGYFPQAS